MSIRKKTAIPHVEMLDYSRKLSFGRRNNSACEIKSIYMARPSGPHSNWYDE
jgi:hypothetical protein